MQDSARYASGTISCRSVLTSRYRTFSASHDFAGYGVASRLDYLLIPVLFALGTASLTMVGTNVGAGQMRRARHIAWIAAFHLGGSDGVIGLAAALAPTVWP